MSMAGKMKEIGNAVITPGSLTRGELVLAGRIGGTAAAPLLIAGGAHPGPTLWVQAAIHGGEVGGSLAITRLLQRLNLADMCGAIVGVLAANPLAFDAQTRNTPVDGENMNRCFPGSLDSSITRQMAYRLLQAAEATADIFVDLHSGGVECIVPFYSLYWEDGSEAARMSGAYARSAATDIVWRAQDAWLSGAMFTHLTKRGVPSVIIECGGGGAMPDEHVESFASGIEGIARAVGILPGGAIRQGRYHTIGSCDLAFTREAGFFLPACDAGDTLAAGATVGTVVDIYGSVIETIATPKPAFIAAIGRRYLPVHSGAVIAELNDDHGWSN